MLRRVQESLVQSIPCIPFEQRARVCVSVCDTYVCVHGCVDRSKEKKKKEKKKETTNGDRFVYSFRDRAKFVEHGGNWSAMVILRLYVPSATRVVALLRRDRRNQAAL